MLTLSNRLGIYIPATTGSIEISATEHRQRATKIGILFSSYFGGGTNINDQTGFWLSADNDLVTEPSILVYSYCDDDNYNENWPNVIRLAGKLAITWEQDAISILDNTELCLLFAGEDVEQIIVDKLADNRPYADNWPVYHSNATIRPVAAILAGSNGRSDSTCKIESDLIDRQDLLLDGMTADNEILTELAIAKIDQQLAELQ